MAVTQSGSDHGTATATTFKEIYRHQSIASSTNQQRQKQQQKLVEKKRQQSTGGNTKATMNWS